MNRASVSIVSNIVEGAGRGDSREVARLLRIARGLACELVVPLIQGRITQYDSESYYAIRHTGEGSGHRSGKGSGHRSAFSRLWWFRLLRVGGRGVLSVWWGGSG